MPRAYHYPSREQRTQRALIATVHAQTVQTASQAGAAVAAVSALETAVGGNLSELAGTIAQVEAVAENLQSRIEALEAN